MINKIAFVVSGFPQISQTFIALQIAELYYRGYSVDIINLGKIGDKNWIPEYCREAFKNIIIYNSQVSGIKILKIFFIMVLTRPFQFSKILFNKEVNIKTLKKMIKDTYFFKNRTEYDIIHFQFANLAARFIRLKKYKLLKTNAKLVCSVRGYDITSKQQVDAIELKEVFQGFSLFLPVCEYFKNKLLKNGCLSKIKVIHSPVNAEVLSKKKITGNINDSGKVRIISVGRLVEKKGFEDVVFALKLLPDKINEIQYSIIGDGPLYDKLMEQIHELQLEDNVKLLGKLPSDKTIDIISESDILIAPSKTAADGDSEGIPNVLKEAMILGLQVIGTIHSGIPELIEDGVNGFLVPESDPAGIADAINKLLSDKKDWDKRSRIAAETVFNEYSITKTTNDLIAAYTELVN